jgi:hypothetical protein
MDERGTAYPVLTPVFYSGSSYCFLIFALFVVVQCIVPIVAYIFAYYPFLISLKFIYLPQAWLTKKIHHTSTEVN